MVLGLSRPTAWFDLDTEVDTFSNVIDMGLHGLEGVLVFGSENLESRGACGRLSLRPCHRTTSNGLCGIFQKCSTINTTTGVALMPPPTLSIAYLPI